MNTHRSPKRLETLVRLAIVDLDKPYNFKPVNGVDMMEIARAVDKLRDAEKTLRAAYDPSHTPFL